MSQAKFINVSGQWVHPDFILSEKTEIENYGKPEPEKTKTTSYLHLKGCGTIIYFPNKTIDEVAEEYNRQVDVAWKPPIWYGDEKKQPLGLTDKELVINEKRCRCPPWSCHHYIHNGVKQ
jgi:hypothetical protein